MDGRVTAPRPTTVSQTTRPTTMANALDLVLRKPMDFFTKSAHCCAGPDARRDMLDCPLAVQPGPWRRPRPPGRRSCSAPRPHSPYGRLPPAYQRRAGDAWQPKAGALLSKVATPANPSSDRHKAIGGDDVMARPATCWP